MNGSAAGLQIAEHRLILKLHCPLPPRGQGNRTGDRGGNANGCRSKPYKRITVVLSLRLHDRPFGRREPSRLGSAWPFPSYATGGRGEGERHVRTRSSILGFAAGDGAAAAAGFGFTGAWQEASPPPAPVGSGCLEGGVNRRQEGSTALGRADGELQSDVGSAKSSVTRSVCAQGSLPLGAGFLDVPPQDCACVAQMSSFFFTVS